MTRTAIVTGASGLLGRQVLKAFQLAHWNVVGTGLTRASPPHVVRVDLNNEAEVTKLLDETRPDAVVHCAANRFPDQCDADPAGTRALNVQAPQRLAALCAARDVVLIYISTDYVFPGREGEAPYAADAAVDPPNLYGQTKYDGEVAVLDAFAQAGRVGRVAVLRVPVLYGSAPANAESAINCLIDTVWKAQEPGASITMDAWQVRYPTNTEDVARVCKDLATKFLDTPADARAALPPRLQFSSEDRWSKYAICQLFAEILGLPLAAPGMVANAQGNTPGGVQRPYDCHLSTKELQALGIDVTTQDFKAWWRRELRAFRR